MPRSREAGEMVLTPHPAALAEKKSYLVETYGCQMNVADTEIVESILLSNGFNRAADEAAADVILLNTCAIRENAESKIWQRLYNLKSMRRKKQVSPTQKIALLGCMAERLKAKLLEEDQLVDIVAGPDAYRDLPRLISSSYALHTNANASMDISDVMNVQLSMEETYADVKPVREDGVSAFVSIMRGCNNMCSYCIVPFTRGRERSRPMDSILGEVGDLSARGFKEVVLLGQNVNSYVDSSQTVADIEETDIATASGFSSVDKRKRHGASFAALLQRVAEAFPHMRFRFTSPHPKDFSPEVISVIANYPNVCNSLHMPAQSGSDSVLLRMRRFYTHAAYLELIAHVRDQIPNVSISSDFIAGFCGETEEEHQETLRLLNEVHFDQAFMFAYSMREKTHAHRKMVDDVPDAVKQRRLSEIIELFHRHAKQSNERRLGQVATVLVEGPSRRDVSAWSGRADSNHKVIFPMTPLPDLHTGLSRLPQAGDLVEVNLAACSSVTFQGQAQRFVTLG